MSIIVTTTTTRPDEQIDQWYAIVRHGPDVDPIFEWVRSARATKRHFAAYWDGPVVHVVGPYEDPTCFDCAERATYMECYGETYCANHVLRNDVIGLISRLCPNCSSLENVRTGECQEPHFAGSRPLTDEQLALVRSANDGEVRAAVERAASPTTTFDGS